MFSLNTRCREILMLLLQSQSPLASADVGMKLGISQRQVRYSLDCVQSWLEEKGVFLEVKPGWGVYIDVCDQARKNLIKELEQLKDYYLFLSPSERLQQLVFFLLTTRQPLISKRLELKLGISRTTVFEDVDKAEKWLQDHGLNLIRRPNFGFKVVGKEGNCRGAIVDFLMETTDLMCLLHLCQGSEAKICSSLRGKTQLFRALSEFIESLEVGFSVDVIRSMASFLQLQLADSDYVSLVLNMAVLIWRVQGGDTVELSTEHLKNLKERREFQAAIIASEMISQRFDVDLSESEVAYIAMHLTGVKTQKIPPHSVEGSKVESSRDDVSKIVDWMLAEASTSLHPSLRTDQQLRDSLTFHLGPVLNRLKFDLHLRNPFLKNVKRNLPYIFEVAERCSNILEAEVGRAIPESEIAYIAMLLESGMERLCPLPVSEKKVLVVCGEGVVTAELLVSRMKAELPEIAVVDVMSALEISRRGTLSGVDAIVSTMPMERGDIPVIVVNPMLGPHDKDQIRKTLRLGTSASILDGGMATVGPSLEELVTEDVIQLNTLANSWQEVVEVTGRLLLNVSAIEARYIEAMKETILVHGPYVVIAPGIALLHARPGEGVRKVCIALVTLEEAVPFGNDRYDPVDLSIALGTIDKQAHLRALQQLMEVLSSDAAIKGIREAETKGEIVRLLSTFAKEKA